jgi:hypothetical protein
VKVLSYSLAFLVLSCGDIVKETVNESYTATYGNPTATNNSSNSSSDSTNTTEILTVPNGIIHGFNLSSCPSGWSEFTSGKGRILIGAGSGNTDNNSNSLTTRSLGSTGGLEYKTALPYHSTGLDTTSGAGNVLGKRNIWRDSAGGSSSALMNGDTTDSNLPPFKAYLWCEKVGDASDYIPAQAITAQDNGTCSDDWDEDTSLAGRTILGVGSGNLDSNSASLTNRSLAEVGGRESVKGIGVGVEGAVTVYNTPTTGYYIGDAGTTYHTDTSLADGCLGAEGCLTDPNLPPFVALNYCKLSTNSTNDYPTNTVSAFNLSNCPTGWSDYSLANGRTIIGAGSGNSDTDSIALTSRSRGDTGGWEKTNSIPVTSSAGNTSTASGNILASKSIYYSGGVEGYTATITDSNLPPFVVVKYCIKN